MGDLRKDLGERAEKIALEHLLSMGYVLIEKNWRVGHKEIDLIMESADFIHIVEVRSRSSVEFIHPRDTVVNKKQRHLFNAARAFLSRHTTQKETSFDIVSIVFKGKGYKLEYIKDAFYPFYH